MDTIISLLREAIGLDASSIGLGAVERAVQQRIGARKFGLPQYTQHLRESPEEMRALIESVIVPETWFFRDPGAFKAIIAQARKMDASKRLRFLCLPCATGEEPFSLAMALLDAGFTADRFHIEAVDVSARVIEHASRAVYGRNSFRGSELEFRDRYFKRTSEGWELHLAVRRLVNFRQANILDEGTLHGIDVYHGIFCRNLLIYFDSEMQGRSLKTLSRLLSPDGLLCVAPAESGLMLRHEFTPAGLTMAFAFRKGKVKQPAPAPKSERAPKPKPSTPVATRSSSGRIRFAKATGPVPVKNAAPAPTRTLTDAMRLADKGSFEEVAAICHHHLATHGASADAYYLLALVSDALDRTEEAAVFYRKALYLEPKHREALGHFSLLAEKLGDPKTAATLRERVRRLESKAASE
jgi:chemotaxis protein methyltransferase WspC